MKTQKRFHSPRNDVRYIWTVVIYYMGDSAVFDTHFHYGVDSSHSKQFIIFSYLIDNPKCSLNNCLVTVESSQWDSQQSVICSDQQVLFEARVLELRGFFVVERILESYNVKVQGIFHVGNEVSVVWINDFDVLSFQKTSETKILDLGSLCLKEVFFSGISCFNF